MKRATRPWVRKAERDFALAKKVETIHQFHDAVCFHSQQCAEKYLKAMLVEANVPVPKTHDLDRLLALVAPTNASLGVHRRGLLFLTSFAVDARYPGFDASKRQATSALRWAERLRHECRMLLGIKP